MLSLGGGLFSLTVHKPARVVRDTFLGVCSSQQPRLWVSTGVDYCLGLLVLKM